MKKLIVNADDFGLTEGVSYGILRGHEKGCITSTSLLVNLPFSKEATSLLKKYSYLGVGIHLNVTLGKPVSPIEKVKSLIDENGKFHSSKTYLQEGFKVDEEELWYEFEQQIQLFIKLIGRKPDHINVHHFYDFFGNYPSMTQRLIEKYHVPMRMDHYPDNYEYEVSNKLDIFLEKDFSVETCHHYLKNHLKGNLVEIPVHAGYVDYELMKISSLNIQRVNDLHVCMSHEFISNARKLGYGFYNWKGEKIYD